MTKTDKMLLIEARAGMPVEQVLIDAYHEGGNIYRAAEIIQERFGLPMSYGLFSDWVAQAEGEIRKELVIPGFEGPTVPAEETVAA